jgi:diguanylate cyclase (GGDEF)-like protein
MAEPLKPQHALAILYDLSLTIGSEVGVAPLLTRTLQRFMFHTGFPVGLALEHGAPTGKVIESQLVAALGDYALARRTDRRVLVDAELLAGEAAVIEASHALGTLQTRRPSRFVLRLPVAGFGTLVLLGPANPNLSEYWGELFAPVLSRLATAIVLCRGFERDVKLRLERASHYDPLTDLPNGTHFGETIARAIGEAKHFNEMFAMVSLDIDDFKGMNKEFGPEFCDRVIVEFSHQLERACELGEEAARVGGDEFAVLLNNIRTWEELQPRVSRLLAAAAGPLSVDGIPAAVSVSTGIAVYPSDATDADSLMRAAQTAMFGAKQESRGSVRFFDAEKDRRLRERQQTIKRLAAGLASGELRMYYQPQVDMASGKILGFEALLRWFDPLRGPLLPNEFLPLLGDSEVAVTLGNWVMREALRQVVAWREQGLDTRVSVNIDAYHLQRKGFAGDVRAALADVPGASPHQLEIEILETSVVDNFALVRDLIDECKSFGVDFALDDFGTGYSSLAYLSRLPTKKLKIDQVFIRSLFLQADDSIIVQAVVQMAQLFQRELIAEGVESLDHALLLQCMGCTGMQGYGISPPMEAERVPAWAAAYKIPAETVLWMGLEWSPPLYELFREIHLHRRMRDRALGIDAAEPGSASDMSVRRGLQAWMGARLHGPQVDLILDRFRAADERFHQLVLDEGDPDDIRRAFDDLMTAIVFALKTCKLVQ